MLVWFGVSDYVIVGVWWTAKVDGVEGGGGYDDVVDDDEEFVDTPCDEDEGVVGDVLDDGDDDEVVALVAIARAPEEICEEVCEPAAEDALKADCALNAERKFARNGRFVDILEESEWNIR
ncbi:hypothetical protein TSTA_038030 [Talaromyces stipitatus ATCC 10500]|uniref:Uncharacterized protein n=1 Tax=Talaromyces stipitatus (strain ATCC 10500 / CBS 375.48 / QM 6759 / NRRL 1006) TaxID=441959 RepID=B8M8S7_TALSN|nr:uncharacterized protein TSTA_038030 [Talaromyces stipitatus ATCC 10500]EED20590.1 hypothetical protein TSTA_038030 [Talaromyces stipitatus ATCC 10500]